MSDHATVPTAEGLVAECTAIVREAMRPHLPDGVKAAVHAAARGLGLSPRRVRSYRSGEVRVVDGVELLRLRAQHSALLRQRQEALSAELARVEAELKSAGG